MSEPFDYRHEEKDPDGNFYYLIVSLGPDDEKPGMLQGYIQLLHILKRTAPTNPKRVVRWTPSTLFGYPIWDITKESTEDITKKFCEWCVRCEIPNDLRDRFVAKVTYKLYHHWEFRVR